MSRKRRSKSSDEVTLEIRDSEGSEKNYWNLRDKREYNYEQDSSKGLKDEIRVEFNLDENRNLTEEQKQTILNTLLQKPKKTSEKKETIGKNRPNIWMILLFLLALSGPTLALIALNSGC